MQSAISFSTEFNLLYAASDIDRRMQGFIDETMRWRKHEQTFNRAAFLVQGI